MKTTFKTLFVVVLIFILFYIFAVLITPQKPTLAPPEPQFSILK